MPTPTTYTYSIVNDFPGGAINPGKFDAEIRASAITIALDYVSTVGDDVNVLFKDVLPSSDKTVLDGDVVGHPKGGLIADHDNTADPSDVQIVEFPTPQFVWNKPTPIGTRAMIFSQDFTDKTTWFTESVAVTDEAVGTGDGTTVTFNLAHPFVIDLSHGKISDEDYILAPGGGSYVPVVKVDGVTKTEREYGMTTGGDYTIDYAAGTITFFTAPANTKAITCSYYYSPADSASTFIVAPKAGKVLTITAFEMNLSADMSMDDTIITAAFIDPQALGLPAGAKVEVPGSRQYFKNIDDIINYTQGSFPPCPVIAGTNGRGLTQQRIQFRFSYGMSTSVMDLDSAYGLELHVWLQHHIPLGGEKACVTFEGISN